MINDEINKIRNSAEQNVSHQNLVHNIKLIKLIPLMLSHSFVYISTRFAELRSINLNRISRNMKTFAVKFVLN